MKWNRRKFLKRSLAAAGLAALSGAVWVRYSGNRSARWLRQMFAESVREVAPAPVIPTPTAWKDNAITICWVGHATVLINFYGVRIITDPALFDKIGINGGLVTLGPKRLIAPALRFEELPPVDVILVSHGHYDHMDVDTLRKFKPEVPVVTAKSTTDVMTQAGLRNVTELGWGDSTIVKCPAGGIEISGFEVKHWGERWPSEIARGYNGYILRREGRSLIFGGDTAKTPLFEHLRSRGPYEAAIMPIGSYEPWIRNHCTPEEAVEMANMAGAKYIVPVHHQTFRLSNEALNEPIERIEQALQTEPERLALRKIGEHFVCPGAS